MPRKAKTTVEMDENGRLTIPKSTRKALQIDGESVAVELDVMVLDFGDDCGSEE